MDLTHRRDSTPHAVAQWPNGPMRPALLYVLQAYIKEQRWLDQVFDKYDTNKSGQLEKGQLIELLRRDNPTPTPTPTPTPSLNPSPSPSPSPCPSQP